MTITLNSLGNSSMAGRESTAVDNTTNLYLDALVEPTINFSGALGNNKTISLWAHGSVDGTTFTDGLTGVDAAYTCQGNSLYSPQFGLRCIGAFQPIAATRRYGPYSVASAFGGILPPKWGILLINISGQSLQATANTMQYRGVYATIGG
jgi:hypothetical protein